MNAQFNMKNCFILKYCIHTPTIPPTSIPRILYTVLIKEVLLICFLNERLVSARIHQNESMQHMQWKSCTCNAKYIYKINTNINANNAYDCFAYERLQTVHYEQSIRALKIWFLQFYGCNYYTKRLWLLTFLSSIVCSIANWKLLLKQKELKVSFSNRKYTCKFNSTMLFLCIDWN